MLAQTRPRGQAPPRSAGAARSVRRAGEQDHRGELQAGKSLDRVGHQRRRRPDDRGLLHRHQLQPRRDGAFKIKTDSREVSRRHLSDGLLRRPGRAADHDGPADRAAAPAAAGVRDRLERPALRLRHLGRVGLVGHSGRRGVGRLRRAAGAGGSGRELADGQQPRAGREAGRRSRTPTARSGMGKLRNPLKEPRASHIVFIVRDDASKVGRRDADVRPDVDRLQPLRARQLYNGTTSSGESGGRRRARQQGELQPADYQSRSGGR